jgi:hypothetical protein
MGPPKEPMEMAVTPTKDDFREFEARITRHSSILREIALTFLGAGIQVAYSLPVINLFVASFGAGVPQLPTGDQTFEAIYLSIGLLFAIPASLAFRPKRMISPFWIQLLTWTLGEVVAYSNLAAYPNVFYQFLNGQTVVKQTALQFALGYSVLYLLLLMVVGFVQFFIVRWIVGLNGTENDIERRTFILSVEYKQLVRLVADRIFRSVSRVFLRERSRGHFVIFANNQNGAGDKIVLGVSPDPKGDPTKSLLATVAFSAGNTSISKTDEASALLESSLLYLEQKSGLKREQTSTDNDISDRTMAFALRRTKPSLGIVNDIPRYHLFALSFTFLLALAMSAAYFVFHAIDSTAYTDSLVLIAVAVVIEFGPLIRESLSHKEEPAPEDY